LKKAIYTVKIDVTNFTKAIRKWIKDKKKTNETTLNILDEHLNNYIKLYNLHGKILKSKLFVEGK